MPVIKPTLLTTSPSEKIARKLDELSTMVKSAQTARGEVDLAKLQQQIEASQDSALIDAFEPISASFRSPGTTTLSAAKSRQILESIELARHQLRNFDANGDGALSFREVPFTGADLAQEVVISVVRGAREAENDWWTELAGLRHDIRERGRLDAEIVDNAKQFGKGDAVEEALMWAFRARLMEEGPSAVAKMSTELRLANDGVIGRFLMGSLTADEAKTFLKTDDLAAFTEEAKRRANAAAGGDYLGTWVTGKDIPGMEQLKDPEYQWRDRR